MSMYNGYMKQPTHDTDYFDDELELRPEFDLDNMPAMEDSSMIGIWDKMGD